MFPTFNYLHFFIELFHKGYPHSLEYIDCTGGRLCLGCCLNIPFDYCEKQFEYTLINPLNSSVLFFNKSLFPTECWACWDLVMISVYGWCFFITVLHVYSHISYNGSPSTPYHAVWVMNKWRERIQCQGVCFRVPCCTSLTACSTRRRQPISLS